MSRTPPFPIWLPRRAGVDCFESDRLDEVQALVSAGGVPASAVVHGRGPFRYERRSLPMAQTMFAGARAEQTMTVRGHVQGLALHLAAPPGSTYLMGRRRVAFERESAMLLPPGLDFSRHSPPGWSVGVHVAADPMRAELAARRAEPDADRIELPFALLALAPAERTSFYRACADLLQATAPGGDVRAPAHAEARLRSLMATLMLRHAPPGRAGGVAIPRLAALEDWIEAPLAEPMTLGRLCAQTAVGARTLQKAFELRRGMSPMRFVAERRYAAARRRLLSAPPGDTVTGIAIECGFDHLSRFARGYRELYGESPSRTLSGR